MNNRRLVTGFIKGGWLWVLVTLLALGLGGCSGDSGPVDALPVRLALALQPSSGLTMVAIEQGYFERNGLDVTIKEFPSGKRALRDSFLRGESDLALAADVPVVMALLEGRDFSIVAKSFTANNVNRIIARKDSGIDQPSALKGRRVATQRGSAVHFFLHLFLAEHGMSSDQLDLQYFKAEQLPSKLIDNEIDAFSMREPFISVARQGLPGNYVIFEAPGVYRQMDLVVASRELVEERPEVIRRLLRSLVQAERFVQSNPARAIEVISSKLGVRPESLYRHWPELSMGVSMDQSMLLMLEDLSRWAMAEELVEQQPVPNYLEYLEISPLQEVDPRAVSVIQ